jgi:hypothetical protein
MKNRTRVAALLSVAVFLATGCTSLQNVPLSQAQQGSARPNVEVGESVVVTKKDGAKEKFKVSAVNDDALVGQNVRVPYGDIASLQVERSDGSHTKAILIGAAIVGAIALAAAASSGGGSGMGSGY